MHRDIDLPSAQGIAYGADKDPGSSDLGEMTLIKISGSRNAYEGGADPAVPQRGGHLGRPARGQAPTYARPAGSAGSSGL